MRYTRIDHEDYYEEIYDPTLPQHDDPGWPSLANEAFHGLAGCVVFRLAPDTEADQAALLLQFLVSFGNALGRRPYYLIEGTKHYPNLFTVLAGQSAKARKGTAADRIRQIFDVADPEWAQRCIRGGISSGEGILWAIRDPIHAMKKGELQCVDLGVEDKRLLLDEREYQQALTVMTRPGNTVSRIIRDGWDGRPHIESLTKNSPARVTNPMISIMSHITIEELRGSLDHTSMANGYANRFLFACVRRGQLLPHGGESNEKTIAMLGRWIGEALTKARSYERIIMTPVATKRWAEIYKELSSEQPGLLGAITARAEAQTLRLALVYALIDSAGDVWEDAEMRSYPGSDGKIDVAHLEAGLAIWRYCEASAKLIFGDTVGDPLADEILRVLHSSLIAGMTRTDLYQQFKNSHRAVAIGAALSRLQQLGRARCERPANAGPGRPTEIWFATAA